MSKHEINNNVNKSAKEPEYIINDMNDLISENPSYINIKNAYYSSLKIKKLIENGLFDCIPNFNAEEILKKIEEINKYNIKTLTEMPDKFNKYFKDKGWIAYESMDLEMMKTSIEIAEKDITKAEKYLIDYYSKNLDNNLQYLSNYPEELTKRKHLIDLAYEEYKHEKYYSCTLLLFSIIDGFVADTNISEGRGFFTDKDDIYSWDSIAAHKSGLNEIKKLFYKSRGKTNKEEIFIPYRNGIVHGRDLNYNNKFVATKLWATLFALKDGVLAIKNKGKQPPEKNNNFNEVITLCSDYAKNKEHLKIMEEENENYEKRNWTLNHDYTHSENLEDYPKGSSEYTLVKFFDYWKNKNFGKIAKMKFDPTEDEKNIKKYAGKLKKEYFNRKELLSFKILSISDESAYITNFSTELIIKHAQNQYTANTNFRLIYDSENNVPIRKINNGEWKIANYSNIKNLK